MIINHAGPYLLPLLHDYAMAAANNHLTSNARNLYSHTPDDSATCDRGWVSHASSCYLFLSEAAGAHQHFNTCATHGSLLVSVSDQEEWDFLSESMASKFTHVQIARVFKLVVIVIIHK